MPVPSSSPRAPRTRTLWTLAAGAALLATVASACSAGSSSESSTAAVAQDGGGGAPALPEARLRDNTFDDVGENPWIDPGQDARSTFGLDVDTASYTVAQRWIDEGLRPEPASVRVEEYVNGAVDAPAIPGDGALRAEVAGAESPFAGNGPPLHLLRVGVQGAPVERGERPDADLTFVIDVSGSMGADNRLGLVKRSLLLLAGELRPTDTIAIVVYGSEARVVLDPTPLSDRDAVVEAIEGLETEGSTNAEAGLRLGYGIARETLRPGRINRVVLASDGVANVGVTDGDKLVRQLRDDADAGVQLVTLGYGMGNFNDALMEQLADRGDGFYAYIDDLDEAARLFRDELTASLLTVAEDARTQVTFDPAAVASYRLVGYENRDIADEDFADDTVDAGDVGAGHSVTALYEVELRPGVAGTARPVATVDLRWLDPASDQPSSLSLPVTGATLAHPFADADDTTRFAALVAGWAEVMGARTALAGRGVDLDLVLSEVARAEQDLGQVEGFAAFAQLARRSASL